MLNLMAILNSNAGAALLGVVLGFILSFGVEFVREIVRKRKILGLLERELESIQYQIVEKKRALQNATKALEVGGFLDPRTIPVNCLAYRMYLSDIAKSKDVHSLNCLYAIYERIILAEAMLSEFKGDFFRISEMGKIDPFSYGKTFLSDISEAYDATMKLIQSYRVGRPIDVFYMGSSQAGK